MRSPPAAEREASEEGEGAEGMEVRAQILHPGVLTEPALVLPRQPAGGTNTTGRNHVHNVCGWHCSAIHKHYEHDFAIRAWFCTVEC